MRGLSLTKKKKISVRTTVYFEVVIGVKLILKHVGGASTRDSVHVPCHLLPTPKN